MRNYDITGMSCAACSARVEKAVGSLEGVDSCSVSLLTNSMSVEGAASDKEIISAVEKAGYGAFSKSSKAAKPEPETKNRIRPIALRLAASAVFLIALMYISMGHMTLSLPLPSFLENNHMAVGLSQLLLCSVVMVINQRFFISGARGIIHKAPNMDTLVSLGSLASFLWSVYTLFKMTSADPETAMELSGDLYFESAAMILTLITVGKLLEEISKGRTTDALRSLMKLAPKTAVTERDGKEIEVPIDEIRVSDIVIIRPGASVPVDAEVENGESAVDESMLTGESVPVEKEKGSRVYAGTKNLNGFLRARALRVGEDTSLSQIIKTVYDASSTKAPIARIADKVSSIFVPTVLIIAAVTAAVWLIAGSEFSFALARGISVLVISCPCALGLATPVSIMVANGVGARNGILFKTAQSIEETGKTEIVALDKTGTLTKGKPSVTDIIPSEGISEKELLSVAYSLEKKSEHPISAAIVKYAEENGVQEMECEGFKELSGKGLSGAVNGSISAAGSLRYISSLITPDKAALDTAKRLSDEGKTPIMAISSGKALGIIAVADTIKDDSADAVAQLKDMGINVVMITGDIRRCAEAVGAQAGVDRVYADVLPTEKSGIIQKLKGCGKTAMVGDGINDAPALASADTGIAVGSGTDIAIDSGDVVLVNSRLADVPAAIRLSKAALKNIRENLFWAFIYNVIGIPLAAGVWIPIFGWTLSPMFGAAAMSLSSFCVVSNALRLNLFKPSKIRKYRSKPPVLTDGADEIINTEKGEDHMYKTTVTVEGMMCPMCEKHVNEAIEKAFDISSVTSSHEANKTEMISASKPDEAKLIEAITAAGYTAKDVTTVEA